LAAFIRSHDVETLVIDLQWNGGGSNYLNGSLVLELAAGAGTPEAAASSLCTCSPFAARGPQSYNPYATRHWLSRFLRGAARDAPE
jgi:hypothetical protein